VVPVKLEEEEVVPEVIKKDEKVEKEVEEVKD
jgi:hypothetical protein